MNLSSQLKQLKRLDTQTKVLLALFLVALLLCSFYVSSTLITKNRLTSNSKAYSDASLRANGSNNDLSVTTDGKDNLVRVGNTFSVKLDGQAKAVTATLLLPTDAEVGGVQGAGDCVVANQTTTTNATNKVLNVTVAVPPTNTSGVCKDTLFTFKMTKLPAVSPFTITFSKDTDANIVAVGGNNMLGQTFAGTFTSSSN